MTAGHSAPNKRKFLWRVFLAISVLGALTVSALIAWPFFLSYKTRYIIHRFADISNLDVKASAPQVKGFKKVEIESLTFDDSHGVHGEVRGISATLDVLGYLIGGSPLSSIELGFVSVEARLHKDGLETFSRFMPERILSSGHGGSKAQSALRWIAKLPDITVEEMSVTVSLGQANLQIESRSKVTMRRAGASSYGEHEISADFLLTGDLIEASLVTLKGGISQMAGFFVDLKVRPPIEIGRSGVVLGSLSVNNNEVLLGDVSWKGQGVEVKCEAIKLKKKTDIIRALKTGSDLLENLEEAEVVSPRITLQKDSDAVFGKMALEIQAEVQPENRKPFKESLVQAFSNLIESIDKARSFLLKTSGKSLPRVRVVGATFDFADTKTGQSLNFLSKASLALETSKDTTTFEVVVDSPDTKGRANKVTGKISQGSVALDVAIQSLRLAHFAEFMPRFIVTEDSSLLYDTKAKFELKEGELLASGSVRLKDTALFFPLVASVPMKWREIEASGAMKLARGGDGKWSFVVDDGFIALGDAHFDVKVAINDVLGTPKVKFRSSLQRMKAQDLFDSLPAEAFEALRGVRASGSFAFSLSLELDFADLSQMKLDIAPDVKDLVILDPGQGVNLQLLNQDFYHRIEVPSGKVVERLVGPSSPAWVPLDHVPKHLIDALLTSEDAQFFTHRGFSLSAMKRSLKVNLERGGFYQGASTLSQQLAKNLFLPSEKTIVRKIQEAFITWQMERYFTKEKILELYLNVVEWGPDCYGLKEAAIHYFGKTPEELNPLESAYLVTILPNPSLYHKFFEDKKCPPKFERRVKSLLLEMKKRGLLRQDEADFYLQQKIVFSQQRDEGEEDYEDE
jgi:hypothetical protein